MSLRKSYSFFGVFHLLWATVFLIASSSCSNAFSLLSFPPASAATRVTVKTTCLNNSGNDIDTSIASNDNLVESLTVSALPDNHEHVGQELAESIQRWLDAEWMPQDVHLQMGLSAKASYVKCRVSGHDDLMMIMTTIVDDLMQDWYTDYDAEAFVNAWDVANYVSDYLTKKQGIGGCECSARIH